MILLKSVLDIKKHLESIAEFYLFLRKNKILTFPMLLLISAIGLAAYLVSLNSYNANRFFDNEARSTKINDKINEILQKCGDKTAISVSVVSTKKQENSEYWDGLFEFAKACDFRQQEGDCIVDLKAHNQLYNTQFKIDENTYNLLVKVGKMALPQYYYLRDASSKQDINVLNNYPSMLAAIKITDWYREETMNDLWITSILNFNNNILYVVTFSSGKSFEKLKCHNQNEIMIDLKNFITNL